MNSQGFHHTLLRRTRIPIPPPGRLKIKGVYRESVNMSTRLVIHLYIVYTYAMFSFCRKSIILSLILCLGLSNLSMPTLGHAQALPLPAPGQKVSLSPVFNPPVLKGIKVFADKPFKFDFILAQGDDMSSPNAFGPHAGHSQLFVGDPQQEQQKSEANKLIKYFLAALTTPEGDLWVNLSPYEKNRIIPTEFGQTAMGRDLLAQDYILKQITASLMDPDSDIGRKFWDKIYKESAKRFGTTNVPVNTFNKVWIVPNKAEVYEGPTTNGQATAYVTQATLKVMLEEDYLASEKNKAMSTGPVPAAPYKSSELGKLAPAVYRAPASGPPVPVSHKIDSEFSKTIIREIIIPELTKEINEGKNFAQLRQVYHSLILATWYKKKIKDSIITKQFVDHKKVNSLSSPNALVGDPEFIYRQYLQAFKKGTINLIKEEFDPITGQVIPKKYFAGGAVLDTDLAITSQQPQEFVKANVIHTDFVMNASESVGYKTVDMAMSVDQRIVRMNQYMLRGESLRAEEIFRSLMVRRDSRVEELARFYLTRPSILGTFNLNNLFIQYLGQFSSSENIAVVAKRLSATSATVIEGVVDALLQMHTQESVQAIVKYIRAYTAEENQMEVINYLIKKYQIMNGYLLPVYYAGLFSDNRFIRRKVAEFLGEFNLREVRQQLVRAVKDDDGEVVRHALESLGKTGNLETVAQLNEILSTEPKGAGVAIFDDHSTTVYYRRIVNIVSFSGGNFTFRQTRTGDTYFRDRIRECIDKIEERMHSQRIRYEARVRNKTKSQEQLKEFLQWLKDVGLDKDIVVIGGGVRDILTGKEISDIDISVAIPLSDRQRLRMADTLSQADEKSWKHSMRVLRKLANELRVPVQNFLPPLSKRKVFFKGVEVQYAGPIRLTNKNTGEYVYLKRVLVDRNSRNILSSSAGASLLQMGVDANGNLYGHADAIEDFDAGDVRIIGNSKNFTIGDVLRVLRIKHELGLVLNDEDERLMKETIAAYQQGQKVKPQRAVLKIMTGQVDKLLKKSKNRRKAIKELKEMGIYSLLQKWGVVDSAMSSRGLTFTLVSLMTFGPFVRPQHVARAAVNNPLSQIEQGFKIDIDQMVNEWLEKNPTMEVDKKDNMLADLKDLFGEENLRTTNRDDLEKVFLAYQMNYRSVFVGLVRKLTDLLGYSFKKFYLQHPYVLNPKVLRGEYGLKSVTIIPDDINDLIKLKEEHPYLFNIDIAGNRQGLHRDKIRAYLAGLPDLSERLRDRKFGDSWANEDKILRNYFIAASALIASSGVVDEALYESMLIHSLLYATIGPGPNANGFYVGLNLIQERDKVDLISTILHELGHFVYVNGKLMDPNMGIMFSFFDEQRKASAELYADLFAIRMLRLLSQADGFMGGGDNPADDYFASLPEYQNQIIFAEGHYLARQQQKMIEHAFQMVFQERLQWDYYTKAAEALREIEANNPTLPFNERVQMLIRIYLKLIGRKTLSDEFVQIHPRSNRFSLYFYDDLVKALHQAQQQITRDPAMINWDEPIKRMLRKGYKFLKQKVKNNAFMYRGIQSGVIEGLINGEFDFQSSSTPSTEKDASEKTLGVYYFSHSIGETIIFHTMTAENISNSGALVLKKGLFNNLINKGQAAIHVNRDGLYRFPMMTRKPRLDDIAYIIVPPQLKEYLDRVKAKPTHELIGKEVKLQAALLAPSVPEIIGLPQDMTGSDMQKYLKAKSGIDFDDNDSVPSHVFPTQIGIGDSTLLSQAPGGIDLNPIDQQLKTSGQSSFSFEDQAMSHIQINSLTPVITSIEPLKNLQEFLLH